ncbi:hypothetical protein, partial [Burkholderia cepacia]
MRISSFVKRIKLSALLVSVVAILPCAASAGTARFVSSFSTVNATDSQNLQSTYMSEMDGSNSAYNKLNGVHLTPEQFVSVRGRDSMYQTKAIISVWSRLIG